MNEEKNIALIGQPNVGKTTLFNQLTGMKQRIGNWPGVTVEKKEGFFKLNDKNYNVVDLPGIYSLMSDSLDQKIARDYLIENPGATVIDVIDTPNINRNLYLTLQLIELGISPIICLNLIDEAEKFGIHINDQKLSEKLGLKVIRTSGRHKIGIDSLKDSVYTSEYRANPVTYSKLLENAIHKIDKKLEEGNYKISSTYQKLPKRWLSISLLESDPDVLKEFSKNLELMEFINNLKAEVENEIKHDVESYIVEQRYKKCDEILAGVMVNSELYEDIDTIVVHPVYGLVIFAAVLYLMYNFVFGVGELFSGIIGEFFEILGEYLLIILSESYSGIIVDGLLAGVGAVLEFFPMIFLIMFSLSTLEDTGYLSRVTALTHNIMSKMGLSGKSFIPLITAFGCSVPALMGTRFISSHKERLITLLITPLIPCSARFIIIGFFASAFFIESAVLFTMAILGITFGLLFLVSYVLSKFIKGDSEEYIFELPPYRIPDWKNIFKMTWEKSKEFLKKAGTIIALGSLLFYGLITYPSPDSNYAMVLGNILEIVTKYMGLDWRGAVSLVFGIFAKELVVSSLSILYPGNISDFISPLQAFVLTLVSVLYIPCIATIAAFYLETRSIKWTAFSISYNILLATFVGIMAYNIGKLIGF
ncbi:ferrous iron transport protein B [Methanococcus vannielii SB]|jgi:ferrous iron transport protein B|uniref:Ferrous iron transport protein B n=1 Tax=Methanococcus vannielii (strain ATCC 35089 / DSM 1224 / JCM 13029 / OCM 148 / SB) TaxID=406327 RepID=A6USI9_METVS|nr:ferrous iron transport protein B [Methanococcus vannielii]ABR55461.1 ferrous iron transport protein B [Methanococcus vannielii SB]